MNTSQLNNERFSVRLIEPFETIATFGDIHFITFHAFIVSQMVGAYLKSLSLEDSIFAGDAILDMLYEGMAKIAKGELVHVGPLVRQKFDVLFKDGKELSVWCITFIDPYSIVFFSNIITFVLLPDEVEVFIQERFGNLMGENES